jgi:hypothetical protein
MDTPTQPVSPPATAPRQRRGKPLLPVRGVCSLIDRDEDQTLRLIEDGQIAWCFDLTLDPKRARAKELRVLPAAVADYMKGQPCSLTWLDVLALVLPHDGPEVLAPQIARALNVSGEHVYNLARRKVLAPRSTWKRGRCGSARFAMKSFVEFLRSRRFP